VWAAAVVSAELGGTAVLPKKYIKIAKKLLKPPKLRKLLRKTTLVMLI